MKTYTNNSPGLRGITVNTDTGPVTRYLEPGQSVKLEPALVLAVPDLGKPSAAAPSDDNDLHSQIAELHVTIDSLETENAELRNRLAKLDRDGDGTPGGSKPAEPVSLTGKNKADLLAIAAAEKVADVNDTMTNADIVTAIELHREEAAKATS